MIDKGFKFCSVCINMIKIIPKKLSPEVLKIINNIEILQQLHAEFQLISRIIEEIFDELNVPSNTSRRGEIINSLRYL